MHRVKAAWMATAILCTSFLSAVPASAQEEDLPPPKVVTLAAWNYQPKSGTLSIKNVDLSIADLSLERFNQGYPGMVNLSPASGPRLNNPEHSPFGWRMSNNFDIYVMPSPKPGDKTFQVSYEGYTYQLPQRFYVTVHIGETASGLYRQLYNTTNTTFDFLDGDAFSGMIGLVSGAYVYLDKDGNTYTFNPSVKSGGGIGGAASSQRIDNIVYANGRIRKFYYDSSSNLKLVTDSTGYAILFDIGTNGYVADACAIDMARTYVTAASTCAGQPLTTSYQYTTTYTNTQQLTSFTDALNNTTNYSYGPVQNAGDLVCVKPPGYANCKASLSDSLETLVDGNVWHVGAPFDASWANYDWDIPGGGWTDLDGAGVTAPDGGVTNFTFSNSSPLTITDPLGRTTTYHWQGGNNVEPKPSAPSQDGTMLTEVDFPDGDKYFASYSIGNFNAVTQEIRRPKPTTPPLPDRVVTYTYPTSGGSGVTPQTLAKPLSRIDPNNNETDWTYASWGGTLTEMRAAPSSGAARPLKLFTYVQKYAYVKNSSGTLVSTGQPIWMPATEVQCQTVAASNTTVCDSGAPILTTTYQYGADGTADNLLLRGKAVSDGTTVLRTCYGYDAYSHKISETSPRAGLSTCP